MDRCEVLLYCRQDCLHNQIPANRSMTDSNQTIYRHTLEEIHMGKRPVGKCLWECLQHVLSVQY